MVNITKKYSLFVFCIIIVLIFSSMPYVALNVSAENDAKQVFFLTINSFSSDRRGGWVSGGWTPPSDKLPSQLLTYSSNNGAATTDIYISEPGKYQIAGYYKSHASSTNTRWFQIGISEAGKAVDYTSYRFANFASAPPGVTAYFEGWDSGYTTELTAGKKTIHLNAATIGSVRCAAIIIYKLSEGETFDASERYTSLLDYQDYLPPQNFNVPPTATFISETSVNLHWEPVVDLNSTVRYELYKNDELGTTVYGSDTSYIFENLTLLDNYTFKVVAKDAYEHSNGQVNSSVNIVASPFLVNNADTDFIFTDMSGAKVSVKPIAGEKIKAKLTLKKQMSDPRSGELIFGLYDLNNILIDLKTASFTATDDTHTIETEPITMKDTGHIFRAFLWTEIDEMSPLYKNKIELQ